ncbi:MAG TPA: hypothetical protein VGL62_15630 [Vicinamibacterales bacterium]
MGGAFTAVADDASAVFWNPAGLASGAFVSAVADFNALNTPAGSDLRHQSSAGLIAVGIPPLGLSYTRTFTRRFTPMSTSSGALVRDDTLVAHHFGVTLVQSVWGGVSLGATLKLVHGVASQGFAAGSDPQMAFGAAEGNANVAGAHSTDKFDVDLGVMKSGSLGRVGVMVRDLLRPSFALGSADSGSIRLDRQVRAGASLNVSDSTLVAVDADLTRRPWTRGDWRDAAVGVEQHVSSRASIRGGLHWNTAGDAMGLAPEGCVGASYAVYGRTSLDGQATFGSANGDRGWGAGVRIAY